LHLNTFISLIAKDLLSSNIHLYKHESHLQAAVDWLCLAHDKSPDDGVSYGYSIRGGWRSSYIETSGYIATTFFNLAKEMNDSSFSDRAKKICMWLCSVQNDDGSFSNPNYSPDRGIVFDTGQDLFGLVRAYKETNESIFLESAKRAGSWLVSISDDKGRWTKNTHNGIPHVYNARTAWALLQLNEIYPEDNQLRVARANLDWALSQENNGYFDQCAFESDKAPFTHTIAYAIRGIWESAQILKDKHYADVALKAAKAMIRHVAEDGFIPGQIDASGTPRAKYCCLTGNAQLAIVWAKMYVENGDVEFREAAVKSLRYVMARQDIYTTNKDVRGAIKGSYPIWGRYSRLTFPNWPTKFFIDAIILNRGWL
jgi:uncharacterized protein YyaL (SSP411 family)